MITIKLKNGEAQIKDYIDVETDMAYNEALFEGVGLETEMKENAKDKKSSKFPMINTIKANRVLVYHLLESLKVGDMVVQISESVINKMPKTDYYTILEECEKVWKESEEAEKKAKKS